MTMSNKQKKQCRLYKNFYKRIKRLEKNKDRERILPISPAGVDREFAVNVWCWIYETEKSLKLANN